MSGAAIRLKDLRFSYGETDFSFDAQIAAGEIVALMGASGSGKSTLLNLVAGFETPSSGTVSIGGRDVTVLSPHERPVTMVFQENNLFGHLDIGQNVGLGRSPSLRLTATDRERVSKALAQTGLSGKEKRFPAELSGGERQRAALARALVRDQPVLLLDEPFASLGPALRDDMLDLVSELQAKHGMTTIMVSHHPDDARRISGSVLFLEAGCIVAEGATADLLGDNPPAPIKAYLGRTGGE